MSLATIYPFDPTGTSSANRITNEQHVITAANFRDYHYVIPDFAPFFESGFIIRLQQPNGTTRTLVLGTDYYLANQFLDASRACAKPIYGAISFLDTDTAGILSISYGTVGDKWNITPAEITRILAEEMRNPRITTWEQITNLPERFPVIDHEWDLVDMVGATSVVESIEEVRDAILTAGSGGMSTHITDYDNPHATSKTQVGLGNVEDFPIATTLQAQEGTSNSFYMTPLRTRAAINFLVTGLVATHAADTNNPHQTNKTQVGLGNVENYLVASQVEASAGFVNDRYMTPLRTAQAIAALAGNGIGSHLSDQLNPHNTTKDQVGLSAVSNFPVATQQEALDGIADDRYMTPRRTKQLAQSVVQTLMGTDLNDHIADTANPHATTKIHVGLGNVDNFPLASTPQAQAGTNNATYMTPKLVKDAIVQMATPIAHATDTDNPHEVTATQLGVYTTAEIDVKVSTLDSKFSNYIDRDDEWVSGMTTLEFIQLVRGGTVQNSQLLSGVGITEIIGRSVPTMSAKSLDIATVTDPVVTPNHWVLLGRVKVREIGVNEVTTAIDTTHPDAYWFMTGGHKQEATPASNAMVSSPLYMVHAKNGLDPAAHSFEVIRLNGSSDSDVEFGYTFDSGTGVMLVWVKVAAGYNDLSVSNLTSANSLILLNNNTVEDIEPIGIVYVAPVSYAYNSALTALASRVQSLEDTVNSLSVV